jgi:hypothetical protein
MAKIIIDTTSGDPIVGRIGRFIVTRYRRSEGTEGGARGIFEGIRKPDRADYMSIGKRALIAELNGAAAHNADRAYSFVIVVSLYDKGTKTWWPVTVKESA